LTYSFHVDVFSVFLGPPVNCLNLKVLNLSSFATEKSAMRTGYIPGLAAIAVGVGIVGVSAAPMDLTLSADATHASSTAASLQPPPGFQLNQKGFSAIGPTGGQLSVSALASNLGHYSAVRTDTANNLFNSPDSLQNQLSNDRMPSPDKFRTGATNDLLRPPPK
jgi:hypothetical protein